MERGKNRHTDSHRDDYYYWQQTCCIAEQLPSNYLCFVRRDSHSHSLCGSCSTDVSRRISEATEPADVMDAAGAAVAADEEEPKAAPQVCLLCLRAIRSGFFWFFFSPCFMSVQLPFICVVLLQQQQTEIIQEAIQSLSRVTRSVAANSPKLAPPSLYSVKTPNKIIGNCNVFSFFHMKANAVKCNSVLREHLCHFPVPEKQQSARK